MTFVPDQVLDNWLTILLGFAACLILYMYVEWVQGPKGPRGLPYLGFYPFLSNNYHLELGKLTKKYGEAFCFNVTGQTYVHLGSVKAVREAHVTKFHCFSDRPGNFSLITDTFGESVGFTNGEKWKVMRKFFVQLLKEYGMGKKTTDDLLAECLQRTLETLKATQGQNFDALSSFTVSMAEVIRGLLLTGTKVDYYDSRDIVKTYTDVMRGMDGKRVLLSGPLLKYVMLNLIPHYRKYRQAKLKMESIFVKIIRAHEKDFDKGNLRDMVDCYINERKSLEELGDPKAEMFSEKGLVGSLVQFFGDGSLSAGYLVASILKDLSHRPEIQKEIQREVDEVVGRNRFPSWGDKNRMPYTNAAICETLRICSLIPAFPSLQCTRATTVCGNLIPKGAVTVVNFWAALHDPDVYEEPDKYDITRFLPVDGKKARCEPPMVFGVGKRSCIGEPLMNMVTFVSVVTVLQNFDIIPAVEDGPPRKEEGILFRATARAS